MAPALSMIAAVRSRTAADPDRQRSGNALRQSSTGPAPLTWLLRHRWFSLVVLLPTILAAFYYGFIASDEYVSQSSFVIRSPNGKTSQMSTLANLIQTTGFGGGQEQTDQVIDYIQSRDALQDLQHR